MVGVRGLEPPTSSSQTTRASQLRYTPTIWCHGAELNCRHKDFQSSALPLSYHGLPNNILPLLVPSLSREATMAYIIKFSFFILLQVFTSASLCIASERV